MCALSPSESDLSNNIYRQEVVHIWEYDTLAHRQKVREALVKVGA